MAIQFIPFAFCMPLIYALTHSRTHIPIVMIMLRSFIVMNFFVSCMFAVAIILHLPQFYYFDVRFTGLSENPNQLALAALLSTTLAICYLKFSMYREKKMRAISIMTILLSIFYGVCTKSDTYMICLAFQIVSIGNVSLWRQFKNLPLIPLSVVLAVTIFLFFFSNSLIEKYAETFQAVSSAGSEGHQDQIRYRLWYNGMLAGYESPLFGNGAGGWSGENRPMEGIEAHNTYIDWFSMTGVLGLAVYLTLIGKVFFPFKYVKIDMYCYFFSILLFGMFHLVLRQPVYWVTLYACLLAIRSANDRAPTRFSSVQQIVGRNGPSNFIPKPRGS